MGQPEDARGFQINTGHKINAPGRITKSLGDARLCGYKTRRIQN